MVYEVWLPYLCCAFLKDWAGNRLSTQWAEVTKGTCLWGGFWGRPWLL
jgi:hypothetical protein